MTIEASTRIARVTVYSDAAHVTRRTTIRAAPKGVSRIGFSDLPKELEPSALRVRSRQAEVRSVERVVLTVPRSERAAADSERIRSVLAQIDEAEVKAVAASTALREELGFIDNLSPMAPMSAGGVPQIAPLRPDLFLKGMALVEARRAAALALLRENERGLEHLRQRRRAGLRRLSLLGDTAQSAAQRSVVAVTVDALAEGPLELELDYLVRWASWRPRYELRLYLEEARLECALLADVWQRSGEDWAEVALALSTAEAIEGLWLPSVEAWTIEGAQAFQDAAADLYREVGRSSSPLEMSDDEFGAYAAQFEAEGDWASVTAAGVMKGRTAWMSEGLGEVSDAPAPRAPHRPPQYGQTGKPPLDHPDYQELRAARDPYQTAGGFPFEHAVRAAATVLSGNQRTRLLLGSSAWPIELEYVLRPAVRSTAFARTHCRNEGEVPLLAGPAAIYVGHDRFGENQLPSTPPGGAITVELGAETAIQSSRHARTTLRSGGLFSREELHHVEVTIDVVNHLPRRASILVEDQIPVSADEKVKISLGRTEPKNAELDPKTGRVALRVVLDPGEKRTLSFDYLVHLPKDTEAQTQLREVIA